MSKLMFVNYYVVQWFFFRICRIMDKNNHEKQTAWGILFPIVPLTGWGNGYIPQKFLTIKLKEIKEV